MRTVYRCDFADEDGPDTACGLDGQSFDASYDECHHPLTLRDATLFAAADELLAALIALHNNDGIEEHEQARAAIAKATGA